MNKNILVISPNGFSKVNNGKTLELIFRKFDKKSLYCLFFRPYDNHLDYDYCESYYAVSESDIIKKMLSTNSKCGRVIDLNKETNNISSVRIYSIFKKNFIKHILFLRDFLWNTNLWDSNDFNNWLNSSNIDAIFFHAPGYIGAHKMVRKIQNKINVPLIVYITDDYVVYNNGNLFQSIYKKRLIKEFQKTIGLSSLNYCIGDLMANEYKLFFNNKFNVLVNSVKTKELNLSIVRSKPIISYFGGLHLGRHNMLLDLAKIIKNNATFRVYTASNISDEIVQKFNDSGIELCDCLYGEQLQNAINNSDALLHIESKDKKYMQKTMLSISTKLTEYMMNSKLIIAYGPEKVASMRLVYENNLGLFIEANETKKEIFDKVKKVFVDDDLRNNYISNAYNYVNKNFTEDIISSRLYNDINSLFSNE